MAARSDARTQSRITITAPNPWASALAWIGTAMDRRTQRRRLAALDPRLLRDIGLTPAQALDEARRPWWQG